MKYVAICIINAIMLMYMGLEIWIDNILAPYVGITIVILWVFIQLFMAGRLQTNKEHKRFDIVTSIIFTVLVSCLYYKYANFNLLTSTTDILIFAHEIILFLILVGQLFDGIGITIIYSIVQGKREQGFKTNLAINHTDELIKISKDNKDEQDRLANAQLKREKLKALDDEYNKKIDSADNSYDEKKQAIESEFSPNQI